MSKPLQGPKRLLPLSARQPLFDSASTRALEAQWLSKLPPGTLMERAGLDAARLLRALWPWARRVSVLCGPGNNGGDGLVLARLLHAQGLRVQLLALKGQGSPERDAAEQAAWAAGLKADESLVLDAEAEVLVDALLGIGLRDSPRAAVAELLKAASQHPAPKLALDLPSGLDADQGRAFGALRCQHTLSFLGVKPGLLTGAGRELAGTVWRSDLGLALPELGSAWACGDVQGWLQWSPRAQSAHGGHKGRQGDLIVVAGSMPGAAQLAALAGLAAGAGRVYLVGSSTCTQLAPELMNPTLSEALARAPHAAVVIGCGGGAVVAEQLPAWLEAADRLVLDADALNAVAARPELAALLQARAQRQQSTVLTPHPLEAARLLGLQDAAPIQAARLAQAEQLALRFAGCTVILKGSGSISATLGERPIINTSGHAALASAGTGDVLAGWLGGLLAQAPLAPCQQLAAIACAWHGLAADTLPLGAGPLCASRLIERMAALHPAPP